MLAHILGITNWGRFQGLQIGGRGITNRGSLRDFKLRQKYYNSGQGLQTGAKRLEIEAEITYWGKRDYRLGQGYTSVQARVLNTTLGNSHLKDISAVPVM